MGTVRRGVAAGRGRTATKINPMQILAVLQTSRPHQHTMGWLYSFMLTTVNGMACMSGLISGMRLRGKWGCCASGGMSPRTLGSRTRQGRAPPTAGIEATSAEPIRPQGGEEPG